MNADEVLLKYRYVLWFQKHIGRLPTKDEVEAWYQVQTDILWWCLEKDIPVFVMNAETISAILKRVGRND